MVRVWLQVDYVSSSSEQSNVIKALTCVSSLSLDISAVVVSTGKDQTGRSLYL